MLLKQLEYFISVVEHNSFTQAAYEHYVSQSAISQQIKSLEASLGVPLMIREKRSFHLTPAGEYLYRNGKQLMTRVKNLQDETVRVGKNERKYLRIGYLNRYSGIALQQALMRTTKRYRDLDVRMYSGSHSELNQMLDDNLVDIIFNDYWQIKSDNDYVTYHDEKFKVLKEIVESANSPLLVFYRFKSDIDRMSEYIDFETIPKDAEGIRDVIKRWNNKEIPVLVTSPKTASRGLNIQDGGHTIIWFNIPPGENELYRQANKRLHRSGQKNTVTVMHLITKGTDELEILNQLNQAEAEQQELMKSLGENS